MSRRRAGSARFDPYYKVQWWDATGLAWRDIQRSWADDEDDAARAWAAARYRAGEWRLMYITEAGRTPVE